MFSRTGIARRLGLALATAAVLMSAAAPAFGAADGDFGDITRKRKVCTPGYSPCIRLKASDVDCWGGSGNGPRYTRAGVVYRVTGRDRYGLDADNDGWGCER